MSEYERYCEIIRFDLKSVRRMAEPFSRVDSVKCQMWSELGKVVSWDRRKSDAVLCRPCLRLKCDLERQVKRTEAESPTKKIKHQSSSSHARIRYMSPASQAKRKYNQKMDHSADRRKLEKYEHAELPLDNEQDDEMQGVMSTIELMCPDELEELFAEGEKHGVGDKLRDIWYSDKRRECAQFQRDQASNGEFLHHVHY